MEWASQHGRIELCSKLKIRMEPTTGTVSLEEIAARSKKLPFNYFQGPDQSLIDQYATEDQPLLVISASQPRRKCELAYLQRFCRVNQIIDTPTVVRRKTERELTLEESAVAFRMVNILESDYFLHVHVGFGKISHRLPLLVDTSKSPIEIILDNEGATVATMLKLYETDFISLSGIIKDFVRSVIFPKVASLVPSSTRAGAEAFLRAIRKPRDVFEYEKSDLGSLSEIWQDYIEGKISLADAARQSVTVTRTTVQVVDRSATTSATEVIPDVLESQRILEQSEQASDETPFEPLPAITRLEKESPVKVLTIADDETPLKGYRCFLALIDRVREERGEFFLQPHRTEIVWGGQKALYIFQHHSRRFGLYYELQSTEVLSDISGGGAFETCLFR